MTAALTNSASFATAALVPSCDASGSGFQCELGRVLHFLYVIAGVLAAVLFLVLLAALHIYRKNKSAKDEDQHD